MALSLNNPGQGGKEGAKATGKAAKAPSAGGWLPGSFTQQPVIQQMKTLGGIFVVLLVAIAILVFFNNRTSTYGTAYVAASGEMRMLSQRLAKASTLALQGNPAAFAQLKDSRETFGRLLERLTSGGDIAGTDRKSVV